jgi:hypothetical protein
MWKVVPQVASVLLKGLLVQWAPKRVVVRRMTLLSVNARKNDVGFALFSMKRARHPVHKRPPPPRQQAPQLHLMMRSGFLTRLMMSRHVDMALITLYHMRVSVGYLTTMLTIAVKLSKLGSKSAAWNTIFHVNFNRSSMMICGTLTR